MAQSALVSVDTNEFINALVAFCSEKEKEGKEERNEICVLRKQNRKWIRPPFASLLLLRTCMDKHS